jgi:MFS family permease
VTDQVDIRTRVARAPRVIGDLIRDVKLDKAQTGQPAQAGRRDGVRRRRIGRLPNNVAFYLLASIVIVFLAGSSAPTPLYAVYQGEWHFSPITTTVVFGIYALAVLSALLIFGKLSDHVGRRPVLLAAIVVQAATMLVFTTAGGVPELVIARIMQGLSTGAAVGAVGAGMLDLDKAKGTIANAVAPISGSATGAILSGVLVQFLPAPTKVVYLVLYGVLIVQAVGVLLMSESSSPAPGALASLRPEFTLPTAVRRPLLAAIPALVATWALVGFYGALSPATIRLVSGSGSIVLGSLGLFALAATAGLAVMAMRSARPHVLMLVGAIALLAGVGTTVIGIDARSIAIFFVGTVITGIGVGGGFQGAVRMIVPLAAPHERAGVLSIVYVVSYLAMGVPAVIAGFLVVHDGGVLATAREYGIAVMILAALALAGVVSSRRRPARNDGTAREPEAAGAIETARPLRALGAVHPVGTAEALGRTSPARGARRAGE